MSTIAQMITTTPLRGATSDANRQPPLVDTIDSADLIANGKLVYIQHRGEVYSLRQTRLGKLILTK